MTEQNKQSSQPFAWYWYDQHGCLYITGDDRKPDLPADAQPLYATEQNKQSDTPAPAQHVQPVSDAMVDAWRIAFHESYDGGKGAADYNSHIRKGLEAALATPSPQSRAASPMSETTPVSETDGAAISERVDNPQRYMCSDNELSRADGYSDTECELMDARWISSAECWDQAASEPPVDKSNSGPGRVER